MNRQPIGLVGYGEVGKIFSAGLRGKPGVIAVSAWDLKFADPAAKAAELAHAENAGIMTPMLLGGARAAELAPVLTDWGMDACAGFVTLPAD